MNKINDTWTTVLIILNIMFWYGALRPTEILGQYGVLMALILISNWIVGKKITFDNIKTITMFFMVFQFFAWWLGNLFIIILIGFVGWWAYRVYNNPKVQSALDNLKLAWKMYRRGRP